MDKDLEKIRHSLSHILAATVLELFPNDKLGFGPAIDNGFYYDFDSERNLTPDDLTKIEKGMRHLLKKNLDFNKRELIKSEAKEIFKVQPYKLELIDSIENDKVSIYDLKDDDKIIFTDICAGPHIDSTKYLQEVGWALDKSAGAYWKGDEKNKMLQRVYGLAFKSKQELEMYLANREEAEKRDHRKLGKELDLFVFSDLVGSGLPLFTPKGTILKEELQKKVEGICRRYGFQKVMTPHLAKIDLYKISGHADKFGDELFHVTSSRGQDFALKPVQCPHQTQIFASRPRSYRDLPIRYMESEKQYRAEKPGEIGGLNRVIAITCEDGHSFCRIDQVKQEIKNMVEIIKDFYTDLGMWGNHSISLSVRDYAHSEKYIGETKDWDHAEKMLQEVSDEMGLKAVKHEGEAALYGPKLDFMFKDAMGRDVQIPTVQLDFATPQRFKLVYTNEEGKEVSPVMVHRAILGSYERFLALLIEHFAGAFPVWLSPVQVMILPVSENHIEYAQKISKELSENEIRVEVDARNESVGRKIRDAEMQKAPFIIVLGDKEIESGKLSVRIRGKKELIILSVDEFIETVKETK